MATRDRGGTWTETLCRKWLCQKFRVWWVGPTSMNSCQFSVSSSALSGSPGLPLGGLPPKELPSATAPLEKRHSAFRQLDSPERISQTRLYPVPVSGAPSGRKSCQSSVPSSCKNRRAPPTEYRRSSAPVTSRYKLPNASRRASRCRVHPHQNSVFRCSHRDRSWPEVRLSAVCLLPKVPRSRSPTPA